jgi:hypothetical protein
LTRCAGVCADEMVMLVITATAAASARYRIMKRT